MHSTSQFSLSGHFVALLFFTLSLRRFVASSSGLSLESWLGGCSSQLGLVEASFLVGIISFRARRLSCSSAFVTLAAFLTLVSTSSRRPNDCVIVLGSRSEKWEAALMVESEAVREAEAIAVVSVSFTGKRT